MYKKLIESQTKLSEDILTILAVFEAVYDEELIKAQSSGLSDSDKQIVAVTNAYLFFFILFTKFKGCTLFL